MDVFNLFILVFFRPVICLIPIFFLSVEFVFWCFLSVAKFAANSIHSFRVLCMHWCTVPNLPANRISARVGLFVRLFVCSVTLEDSAEYPPILLVCRFRLSPVHYDPCYACLPTCCPNIFCRRYAFADTFRPIRFFPIGFVPVPLLRTVMAEISTLLSAVFCSVCFFMVI